MVSGVRVALAEMTASLYICLYDSDGNDREFLQYQFLPWRLHEAGSAKINHRVLMSKAMVLPNLRLRSGLEELGGGFGGELLVLRIMVDPTTVVSFSEQHAGFNTGFVSQRHPSAIIQSLPFS
jgi:hypothetical protein